MPLVGQGMPVPMAPIRNKHTIGVANASSRLFITPQGPHWAAFRAWVPDAAFKLQEQVLLQVPTLMNPFQEPVYPWKSVPPKPIWGDQQKSMVAMAHSV